MRWIISIAALLLMGCQQDPYAGRPELTTPGRPPQAAPKPINPIGTIGLVVPDVMLFVEGQLSEYTIQASVTQPGTPQVVARNLPTGLIFDSTNLKLTWAPDFQAANDPKDPSVTVKYYTIEVQVYNSADTKEALTQTSLVIVRDNPQPVNITSPLKQVVDEGKELVHEIDFEDTDFPTTAHEVILSGFPSDVRLDWPNHAIQRFFLRWTPAFQTVQGKPENNFMGHVVLVTPRGRQIPFDVTWTVKNILSPPVIMGVDRVSQSGDIEFILMAEDPNGEMEPQWTILNQPTDGVFSIGHQSIPKSNDGRPRSAGLYNWRNIPASLIGQSIPLNVQACINSRICETKVVTIEPKARVAGGGRK